MAKKKYNFSIDLSTDSNFTVGGVPLPGSGFEYAESLGNSTTSSSSYQEKLKLTTSLLDAGDYIVRWSAEFGNTKKDKKTKVRVQIDDVTTLTELTTSQFAINWYGPASGFAKVTLTNAIHEIDFDFKQDGGNTAQIKNARLSIERIS